jgi:hypothetical protein
MSGGGDKFEDILSWPVKRVEGVYQAILRTEAVQSIESQRRSMIAAMNSNPNWDSKENKENRQQYLRDLNSQFNQAINRVYAPPGEKEPEIDWENPFLAAHKREIAKTRERFAWAMEGKSAGEILELEEERKKRRDEYDQ